MSRILTISGPAARDIRAAYRWLHQLGAGQKAHRRWAKVVGAIEELVDVPCQWPVGRHEGVRERPVEGYCIMYEVLPDTGDSQTAGDVEIIRVFGPGQDRRLG